ncbi:cationic peroxidase SPC4-like [Canna indica]|uniref:Cationic peroxidase SPC4-like n=1 Tax=Canna indica TaxID=4628 RepID=A0AAQ3JZ12_9LILI|nr:cationic peroxidase SPC4-like [Canna indica]
MAAASSSSSSSIILLFSLSCIIFLSSPSQAYDYPPIVDGLSFTFYESTCPQADVIVRNYLQQAFSTNIGLAAGLLRLHFHDCFVQGCDGSILLDGTAGETSEKEAPPNLTLRPEAFKAINDLQTLITEACGQVVSCADITTLAARDSVYLSGGPNYLVPLGRRDGLSIAPITVIRDFLPPPTSNVSFLIFSLDKLNLTTTDLVTLSGVNQTVVILYDQLLMRRTDGLL